LPFFLDQIAAAIGDVLPNTPWAGGNEDYDFPASVGPVRLYIMNHPMLKIENSSKTKSN